jgi:hypothetical protein
MQLDGPFTYRDFVFDAPDRSVKGEWNLVTLSWNIKRMFALQPD